MTRNQHILAATLSLAVLSAAELSGGWDSALAQSASQAQQPAPAASGQTNQTQSGGQPNGASDSDQSADSQTETPHPSPILAVTSVEIIRSAHDSQIDIVRVTGVVSSGSWSSPTLTPLTSGKPSDGVLDLVFHADVAADAADMDGFRTIEAILPIDREDVYKGVRVRSATNVVALKSWPGYAEVPAPANPCVQCVGKVFVAKGAAAPAGVSAADVVREQDLQGATRIIKPTDGIADQTSDPNRLTLVIGDDGKIIDAAWD